MRGSRQIVAVALLVMAVVCSPAGVCLVEGVVGTIQAHQATDAHAGCANARGLTVAASDTPCCDEPSGGFINGFRFALEKQTVQTPAFVSTAWPAPSLVANENGFSRAAPLVLRI